MDDLAELEGRITMALDRIVLGLEALPLVPASGQGSAANQTQAELEAATAALERERAETARLTEALRIARADKERADKDRADDKDRAGADRGKEERIAELTRWIDIQAQEMQRLRRSNAELCQSLSQLREAAEAGLSDPTLINQALAAELESLRAARAAEAAELDEILSELDPLVTEHAHG